MMSSAAYHDNTSVADHGECNCFMGMHRVCVIQAHTSLEGYSWMQPTAPPCIAADENSDSQAYM